MPYHVLADIVAQIQELLWREANASGEHWNADKEWDCETLENIAAVLGEHGLRPEEPLFAPTIVTDLGRRSELRF